MPDLHYLADPAAVEVTVGVGDALRLLRSHGYLVVCVTNQSGVHRGFFPEETVHAIHRRLNERLAPRGAWIDAFYHCPHRPEENCECRKPGTALFLRAADDWSIDLAASAMVGDRAADIEAGNRLGLFTVLLPEAGHEAAVDRELAERDVAPDVRVASFGSAAAAILARG